MRKPLTGILALLLLCGCALPALSEGPKLSLTQVRLDAYLAFPTCTGETEVYWGYASTTPQYVDRLGQEVEEPEYCDLDHYGFPWVETDGSEAEMRIDGLRLMDLAGQVILDASEIPGAERIEAVWHGPEGGLLIELHQGGYEDGSSALVDQDGRILVPFGRYYSIRAMGADRFQVYQDPAGYGLIDTAGNEIVAPQYAAMKLVDYRDAEGQAQVLALVAESIWGDEEYDLFPGYIGLIYYPDIYLFARLKGRFPTEEEYDDLRSIVDELRAEMEDEEDTYDDFWFSKEGLSGNPMMTDDGRKWYLWYDEGPAGTAWGVIDGDGHPLVDFVGENEPYYAVYHEPLEGAYGAISMPVNGDWRIWEIR